MVYINNFELTDFTTNSLIDINNGEVMIQSLNDF